MSIVEPKTEETVNTEEVANTVDTDIVDTGIIDVDLSATERKKFRINGDNSRIVELNPSDLSIITRIEEAEKKLKKCVDSLTKLVDAPSDSDEEIFALGKKFKDIDKQMRDLIDYVFQSNVSEVCVPEGQGSMYDPFEGKYRYEHIIEALLTFYEGNIQKEYKKMRATISKKTAKYTKKK